MSVDILIYLRDEELPSWSQWQQAIDAEGIDLQIEEFSLRSDSGFRPTKLKGENCGFEYFFGPVDAEEAAEIQPDIADRDREVMLSWHGNELDGKAAMFAAAVLAKMADGVFFDPQGGGFARGDDTFKLLRDLEKAEFDRKLKLAEKK